MQRALSVLSLASASLAAAGRDREVPGRGSVRAPCRGLCRGPSGGMTSSFGRCALRQCPDVLASVAGSMVCGSNSWSNGYHSAPPPFCRHRLPPPAAATLALLPLICRRQPCHHSQPRRRHPQCRRRHAPSPPPLCTARSHECAERSWQLLSWANPPMKLRLRGVFEPRARALPCPALPSNPRPLCTC